MNMKPLVSMSEDGNIVINPQTNVQRLPTSISSAVTPFGCCDFFDPCSDGVMSLHFAGRLKLLDWLSFKPTMDCYRSLEFISYVRAEQYGGNPLPGNITDLCDDPNGIEVGSCRLSIEEFGYYGREGPSRLGPKTERFCKTRPIIRLDGKPVTNEDEWDMRFIMDQMIADISEDVITGNMALGTNQLDGLERWLRTGLVNGCPTVDGSLINWNANNLNGGAGITWNGNAVPLGNDFVDVLLAVYRRTRQRISWSPLLKNRQGQLGDMILLMPTNLIQCFLDMYTCWSVCPGIQYQEMNWANNDARAFRQSLNGGMFGDGQISLDGFTIPIMAWDWGLLKSATLNDAYLLTGSWGGFQIWEGEHIDASTAAKNLGGVGGKYWVTDTAVGSSEEVLGSRVLWNMETNNLCKLIKGWMFPRLWCSAPWAQTRFQDVRCATPLGPLSPDPETSFFPQTSFVPASC